MVRALVSVLALGLVGASSSAQTPATGRIIVYRGSGVMGAGVACPVRYKGKEIVELGRGKYAELVVPAGEYILTNKTASVEVRVAPDQVRYVRCQIKTGFMSGRADLQIVDAESFDEHKSDFEKKDLLFNPFEGQP